MENQTYINHFHLLPFSAKSDYKLFAIGLFFFLYLFGVLINSIIITVIYMDDQLHTPMYIFLCNLALVDICFTTTTVPNLLYMLLSGDNTMSFTQCFTQMYFYVLAALTEDLLIFIMAYDRYVAICHPLHYHSILTMKKCILYATGNWIFGCLNSVAFTVASSLMSFCVLHTVHQFFCDAKALINISCAGTEPIYNIIYLDSLIFGFLPITFSLTSYVNIFRVVLQIKSKEGKRKAFSTCSSHLTLLITYYATSFSVYITPPSENSIMSEQVLTALYAVITPVINPLIYSLRNKDVKRALLRNLGVKLGTG